MTRTTAFILGDQLVPDHPAVVAAVAAGGVENTRVVMVESTARIRQQPYQRKKLVLLLNAGSDACPYNFLYWSFLLEHEALLRANPRLGPAVLGLARIGDAERHDLRRQAAGFLEHLPYYAR